MVAKQLAACQLILVSATGPSVDKLLATRPYFVRTVIPASTYGLANDIATFGSKATLVTSVDVPDEVVYKVTKAILAKSGTLRERQPTLAGMKANDTVRQSLTAPLHPGALKAYKERGLLKEFASTGH
jgi:TRAP transporter TAXI family solute receptor